MSTVLAELEMIMRGRSAAKTETGTLDFKEGKPNLKDAWSDLAEAAVCFANAAGGVHTRSSTSSAARLPIPSDGS